MRLGKLILRQLQVEVFEGGKILFARVADDAIVELVSPRDFDGGGVEAALNFGVIIGATEQEPLFDLIHGLRFNED